MEKNKNFGLLKFQNLHHIKKYYKSFKSKKTTFSQSTSKLSKKVKINLLHNTKVKKISNFKNEGFQNIEKSEKKIQKSNFKTFFPNKKFLEAKKSSKNTIPEYLDLKKYYKDKNIKKNTKYSKKVFQNKSMKTPKEYLLEKTKGKEFIKNLKETGKNLKKDNENNLYMEKINFHNTNNNRETQETLFSENSSGINSSFMSESLDKIIYKEDSSLLKNYEANRKLEKSNRNLMNDSINEKIWKFLNCEKIKKNNSLKAFKKNNLLECEKKKKFVKKNSFQDFLEKEKKSIFFQDNSDFFNFGKSKKFCSKVNFSLREYQSVESLESLKSFDLNNL